LDLTRLICFTQKCYCCTSISYNSYILRYFFSGNEPNPYTKYTIYFVLTHGGTQGINYINTINKFPFIYLIKKIKKKKKKKKNHLCLVRFSSYTTILLFVLLLYVNLMMKNSFTKFCVASPMCHQCSMCCSCRCWNSSKASCG
jgi:hypothetical protein